MSATHDHAALSHGDREHGQTEVATIERRYGQRLRGALGRLNAAAREGIVERDIFGLREALLEPPRPFQFSRDDKQMEAFQRWLRRAEREEVLSVIARDDNEFVRSAYGGGIRHADRYLKRGDVDVGETKVAAAFNLPVHKEQLQMLYTRNFEQLEGITRAMNQQISRELSEGLTAGENPRDIARRVSDRVDAVGKKRATTLARTELSHSYNSAAAKRYGQFGVDEVRILVSDPCPICQRLKAGDPYPVEEAAGLLPGRTHPNCVCSIAPVLPSS